MGEINNPNKLNAYIDACGQIVKDADLANFCPNCGIRLPIGANFCSNCGWNLSKNQQHQLFKGEIDNFDLSCLYKFTHFTLGHFDILDVKKMNIELHLKRNKCYIDY